APRLVLTVTQGVVGLHELVDLAGALIYDGSLAVPIEAPRRVFVREPVAAVDLDAVAGTALAGHRGEPLGQGRLPVVALPLVLHPAGPQPQQARRIVVRDHL